MNYKKVGGIHFVKLGRFGFNFYWSRSKAAKIDACADRTFAQLQTVIGLRSAVNAHGQRVLCKL